MGRCCYKVGGRVLHYVGGFCENNCFQEFGGCNASVFGEVTKTHETCDLVPQNKETGTALGLALKAIDEATKDRNGIFLYTPDMFSTFYWEEFLTKLPVRHDDAKIAVNGCVRTFSDKVSDWKFLKERGITEIWFGVESGNRALRDRYNKPQFENWEVVNVTGQGRLHGINICWFLVTGEVDTPETKLETWNLVCKAEPYRIYVGALYQY